MEPVSASQMRFNRAPELWAAISISMLLVGTAVLVGYTPTCRPRSTMRISFLLG